MEMISDSFSDWPLYPPEKTPLGPLDRKLGEPQRQSAQGNEEKYSLALPGM
jgi:hypothetical protein